MASESDAVDECKYLRDQPFAEECEEALRAAASDIEGGVTEGKYRQWAADQPTDYPTVYQIKHELNGTFAEVCEKNGIETYQQTTHTPDRIISFLIQAADIVGEPLTVRKYKMWRKRTEDNPPTHATINRNIGWKEGCERAGVECGAYKTSGENQYDIEDITTAIRRAADAVGEPLGKRDYRVWRNDSSTSANIPSTSTISTRIGWLDACERADIQHKTSPATKGKFTQTDLEQAVRLAADAVGEPLTRLEYLLWRSESTDIHPSEETISQRIGWEQLCEQTGINTPSTTDSDDTTIGCPPTPE